MKRYVVVHLPALPRPGHAPRPIPAEQLQEFLQRRQGLVYNLTPQTAIAGTLIDAGGAPDDMIVAGGARPKEEDGGESRDAPATEAQELQWPQDFIVAPDGSVGRVTAYVTFPNTAPLFLGDSVYAIKQPLSPQIRLSALQKMGPLKEPGMPERPEWLVPYGPRRPVPESTREPDGRDQFYRRVLAARPVAPWQLFVYLDRMYGIGHTNYQRQMTLRNVAYQFGDGPYRHLWIRRGYLPTHAGECALRIKYTNGDVRLCERLLCRMAPERLAALRERFPVVFRQLGLMWSRNKLLLYRQLRDYYVFQEAAQAGTANPDACAAEIRRGVHRYVENLLNILQSNGASGSDDVPLLNMDALEGNEFLGPQLNVPERLSGAEEAEESEEGEECDEGDAL